MARVFTFQLVPEALDSQIIIIYSPEENKVANWNYFSLLQLELLWYTTVIPNDPRIQAGLPWNLAHRNSGNQDLGMLTLLYIWSIQTMLIPPDRILSLTVSVNLQSYMLGGSGAAGLPQWDIPMARSPITAVFAQLRPQLDQLHLPNENDCDMTNNNEMTILAYSFLFLFLSEWIHSNYLTCS